MKKLILFITLATLTSVSSKLVKRMVNGSVATDKQFPYIVSITSDFKTYHFCGGAIIASHWVLTAGHCIHDAKHEHKYRLYGGTNRRPEDHAWTNRRPGDVIIESSKVFVHPQYHKSSTLILNDLALLYIEKSIQFSDKVQPISLGRVNDVDGVPVITAGWGLTSYESTVESENLRFITMHTMRTGLCEAFYARRGDMIDSDNQICAYSPGQTVCFGDSGGPLVNTKTGRLVGIFSSMQLCESDFPAAFVRVSSYIDWIQKITNMRFDLQ